MIKPNYKINGDDSPKNDSPKIADETGIVKMNDLLRDLAMIKKYAIECDDEKIYLLAEAIEQRLSDLRYGNFKFETSWG